MHILTYTYPTQEHYEHAVFADSMRWVGVRPGQVTDQLCEVVEACLRFLTNPKRQPDKELESFMDALDMVRVVESFAMLSGAMEAPPCDDPECPVHGKGAALDNAFGMEDYTL
jgi:hypothetical protein